MRISRHRGAVVLAVLLCLALVGCSTSQVAVALNVASVAANVASSVISASAMDPATKARVVAYLSATVAALTTAAQDLQAGPITPTQTAQIVAALTAAVVPALPASVSASDHSVILAVVSGVGALVAALQALIPAPALTASRSGPAVSPASYQPTYRDRQLARDSLAQLTAAAARLR